MKNFFKKVLTLTLYFAILFHIVLKNYENKIHIVSGFAKNNGRGAKVISNAKHIKGRLPVL